jgi:predicted pyridoxine 5'-phosphate oxidase superfamily flavin-nucleotide-binding protein
VGVPRAHHGFRQTPARGVCGRVGRRGPHGAGDPERRGNKRADGYKNILANLHVGLLFLIPGRGDTLRINGRAHLVSDAPWFDDMVVKGHRPVLALVVEIDEVLGHCAKAFMRSQLWHPSTWDPLAVGSRPQIAKALERPEDSIEELEKYYGEQYSTGLY